MWGLSAKQLSAVILLIVSLSIGHAVSYFRMQEPLPEVDPEIIERFIAVSDSLNRADSMRVALGLPEATKMFSININLASQEQLEELPGIGPVMARRILDFREKVGAIESKSQLLEVKGIGPKTLSKIEKFIRL